MENEDRLIHRHNVAIDRVLPGLEWKSFVPPNREALLTWEQAVRVLRNQKWLLIAGIACLTALVVAGAMIMRDVYKPVARLEIDPLGGGIKTLHEIENSGSEGDIDYLDTQVQTLQSDALAMRVIRMLRLDENPEFVGKNDAVRPENIPATSPDFNPRPEAESAFLQEQLDLANPNARESSALRTFHSNLTVSPIRGSRLVEVSYVSHDPHLAQAVTNTLVTQFIDQDYKNRYVTTMAASDWLSTQLNDLRQKVSESNRAAADYQRKYNLVESDEHDIPLSQLMAQVSRQLGDAQADRIQAEAYMRMIDLGQAASIPAIRDDIVYQNLQTHYADVRAQLAQAQTIYGDENANVKKLQGEANELAAQIDAEQARLTSRVRTTFAAASAREQMMTETRGKLQAQMGDATSHLVEYHTLKNEATANAQLYNTLQARLKEAGIYAGLRSGNIRVVDMAQKLHTPTGPHRRVIIALGVLLSTMLTVVLAFVRESLDNTVRIPDDIRNWTRLPALAVLPTVPDKVLVQSFAASSALGDRSFAPQRSGSYPKLFWSRSQTAEAEAIRALRSGILSSTPDLVPQVILVSSATAGEGKTTVALNLASVLAQQGRTCLVEGDLRRPMIERALGLQPRYGIGDVLNGKAGLGEALMGVANIPGLAVLPAKSLPDSPADLLASQQMRVVIAELRKAFDYIVIDTPPIIAFSDARSLGALSDAVVLVSRYGWTTRRAIARSAELFAEAKAPVVGVVLNDIDLSSPDYHYFLYGYSWAMRGHKYGYAQGPLPPDDPAASGPEKSRGAHA